MGQQTPSPNDGRRYTRWGIVRQSLKDAKSTVLKDARGWFGQLADWRVSESTLYIDHGDIYSEWLFIPLDEPDDVKRLLSTQLTGVFINEASETNIDLLSDISGRVGRFPNNEFGACSWKGILADTNMPLSTSPWADFIQNPPPEWQVFRQPSGLSADAENLNHLDQTMDTIALDERDPRRAEQGRNYYRRLATVGSPDYIRRYVLAEFGRDPSGSAVFAESFRHDFHVVNVDGKSPLEPVYSRLLLIGQDFGRHPWSLITQLDQSGRLNVLEEVPGEDIGLEQHVRQHLLPVLLGGRYAGRPVSVVGDPAGAARDSLFELNAFDLLKRLGLPAERAPTNDLDARLGAVEGLLLGQVAGKGAVLIDAERCPTLVRALNGQYQYVMSDDEHQSPKPDKAHPWSDVCDCLQYVALVVNNPAAYQWVLGRQLNRYRQRPQRQRVSALGWT